MSFTEGQIWCRVFRNDLGFERRRYYWDGGPIAQISMQALADLGYEEVEGGQLVYIGPFAARLLKYDDLSERWTVCKAEDYWLLFTAAGMVRDIARVIYHRVIMTAMIWNLAEVDAAGFPSWRDLKWRPRR